MLIPVKAYKSLRRLYADRHTIFRSHNANKTSIDQELMGVTINKMQFGIAFDEPNIQLIAARSQQAKGRIKSLWGTLQKQVASGVCLT